MHDVDVLLPVRYPAPWLDEAIVSIVSQSCTSWRGVLVIHGECEGIEALEARLSSSWQVLRAPAEMNLAEVLNLGLGKCTAEFVARMDADDVSAPTRFESQLALLRADPQVAVVGTSAEVIDEAGTSVGMRNAPPSPEEVLRSMRWKCAIVHPSVMFRREVISRIGGYREAASGYEDYDLWLRVLTGHSMRNLDDALVGYRVHVSQVSAESGLNRDAWKQIGQSRIALARSRGESELMARVRQALWLSRQRLRAVGASWKAPSTKSVRDTGGSS